MLLAIGAGRVGVCTFTSEGSCFVTGDDSGALRGWDAETGVPIGRTERMDGAVVFCRAVPQHGEVIAISERGELRLWSPLHGTLSATHTRKTITAAAISSDGTHAAMALREDGTVQVWEMHARMSTARFLTAGDAIPAAAAHLKPQRPEHADEKHPWCWNLSGTHAASVRADGSVIVATRKDPLRMPSTRITALALSEDAQLLATAHEDRRVRLWDTSLGRERCRSLESTDVAQHLAIAPDGRTLITATRTGELRCWDTTGGAPLTPRLEPHEGDPLKRLTITRDGAHMCYELADGGWFELPLPARPSTVPQWFIALAEALVRRHQNEDGTQTTLPQSAFRQELARLPQPPSTADQPWHQLAHWLTATPAQRALWPGDTTDMQHYLEQLRSYPHPAAKREFTRHASLLPLVP